MKIRTDYVTNSSSSSFLLGFQDKGLTQKQKDAIVAYVLKHALGDPATARALRDWYGDIDDYDDDDYERDCLNSVRQLKKDGWTVRLGKVCFEDCAYEYTNFLQGLWKAIERADPQHTKLIDTGLDY